MSVTPSPTLLDEHLAQVAAVFDRLPAPSWSARAYSRILARYYRLLVPEGASVLEIGCGAGDLLAQLPNRDVTGLDVSATQLARARAAVLRTTVSRSGYTWFQPSPASPTSSKACNPRNQVRVALS